MECKGDSFANAEKGRKSVIVVAERNENNNRKVDDKVKVRTYFATRVPSDREDETSPKTQDEYEEWKKKKEEKQKKINEDRHSYKGCFYRVGFKSSQEINLVRLEFFGLPSGKSGDFIAKVRIERTSKVSIGWWWYILRFLFGQSDKDFVTEVLLDTYTERLYGVRGNFRVTLPHPVKIEANKWTEILFELDGPKTTRLGRRIVGRWFGTLPGSEVDITINFLHGSRQLAGFDFTLSDDSM